MRRCQFSIVALGLTAFLWMACSDPSNDQAGIEIGNPEVQAHTFEAKFVVDYGVPAAKVSPGTARMAAETDSVLIDGLSLSLWRLSAYSSYYVYVAFDMAEGLTLWPEYSESAPMKIVFADDTSTVHEDWAAAFGEIEVDDSGLLKEVGAHFAPVADDPQMTGTLKIAGSYVPFAFSFAGLDSLEVRYLKNQLDTAANGAISLTVRFCVPNWVSGLPMTSAQVENDTVHFDALHNAELWDSLTARVAKAFSSAHYLTYYADGTSEEDYSAEVLAGYDIIDSNWVSNGNFVNGQNWILVRQFGGEADTTISNGVMSVNVTNAGTQSYSVQLIHEDIPLIKDRKYKLVFTAIADSEATVTVRIGSYNTYDTEAFQVHEKITTDWQSHQFEYTALVDDLFARLEFNLGKKVNRIRIKDVKIFRID